MVIHDWAIEAKIVAVVKAFSGISRTQTFGCYGQQAHQRATALQEFLAVGRDDRASDRRCFGACHRVSPQVRARKGETVMHYDLLRETRTGRDLDRPPVT